MTRRGPIKNQTNFRFPLDILERLLYSNGQNKCFTDREGESPVFRTVFPL